MLNKFIIEHYFSTGNFRKKFFDSVGCSSRSSALVREFYIFTTLPMRGCNFSMVVHLFLCRVALIWYLTTPLFDV